MRNRRSMSFILRELFHERNFLSGKKDRNSYIGKISRVALSVRFRAEEERARDSFLFRTRRARKADRVNRVDTGRVSCPY